MKILLAATAVALVLSSAAFAQSSSVSSSNSNSQSGATVVQNSSVPSTQRIHTTGTAIAPALAAAGVHSCAGSTSAGFGGSGFGISVGSTYEMQECNRRAYAATLAGMGQNLAALDMICLNPEVRIALNNTGVICPSQRAQAVAVVDQRVFKATYNEDAFFYDKKGRKYQAVAQGTPGATRSATGEWVKLVK